jgi:hypothetical protein
LNSRAVVSAFMTRPSPSGLPVSANTIAAAFGIEPPLVVLTPTAPERDRFKTGRLDVLGPPPARLEDAATDGLTANLQDVGLPLPSNGRVSSYRVFTLASGGASAGA